LKPGFTILIIGVLAGSDGLLNQTGASEGFKTLSDLIRTGYWRRKMSDEMPKKPRAGCKTSYGH
jgi:hypothetical protein